MKNTHRFGLRAQILLALLGVFVLSLTLSSTAAVRLTRTAFEREQARSLSIALEGLSRSLAASPAQDRHAREAAVTAFAREVSARALRIERPDGSHGGFGEGSSEPALEARLASGDRVRVWPAKVAAYTYVPLANLLVFYVGLTGAAVLLLTYLALTAWIVRPLDRLTRGSEQLAQRTLETRIEEEGAAEVARLAASLNSMASQLRAERHALEQRLAELEATTAELRTTHERLVHGEKLASVGRLAAGVAHEIGNPLSAILGLVELLRGGDLEPKEREEFLARIHKETERIHAIIRELLDFARRDDQHDPSETADLTEALQDAVSLVRPARSAREASIVLEVAPGLPRVVGSAQRITQVVLNLLLNSLDAMQGRGQVRVSASFEESECVVRVADDGPGIAETVLPHLFEPFTTTKAPGAGTGLGLAVSHTIVQAMGGSLEGKNRPEGGAVFTLRLKAAT